jgi:hypothetical protein
VNGATDCERIGDGWLAQPANALSSLGLVAVGIWLLARGRAAGDRTAALLGAASAGAGIGSFLYHGPMPPGSRYLHDATGIALGAAVAIAVTARPGAPLSLRVLGPAGAAVALLPVLWPTGGGTLIGVAAGAAAVAVAAAWRSGRLSGRAVATAVALMAAAGALGVLGRTGGPLCDPDAPLQAHGAWHLLLAGAVPVLAARPTGQLRA